MDLFTDKNYEIIPRINPRADTNDTAKLIINGSIALLNIAVASVSGTNQPEISLYVSDVCVGMQQGLPGGPMMAKHANALTSPHLK